MQIQTIERPIHDIVAGLGFELWGIEFLSQGRRSVLRVYIEHENGVTVDDCATVSRQVSAWLDVENPIRGEYTLEVSSPGMDRLLFKPDHYRHYCGDEIQLSLKAPIQGMSKLRGTLLAVEPDHILVKTETTELTIGFETIQKARLIPTF